MSFLNELKRRNVFKVGIGYAVVAWFIAQLLQLIFESFGTPDWVIKAALVLLAAGFPFALFFAWVYEMTPDGLRRDSEVRRSQPITSGTISRLKEAGTSSRQLNSIIYKSRCAGVIDLEMIDSILKSSTKHNAANNITGVLIATKTHFLQVLEGEFGILNETFERISADSRHDTIQLIDFSEIMDRRFGEWAMHGVAIFDLNQELANELRNKFGEENGGVRIPTTLHEVSEFLDSL